MSIIAAGTTTTTALSSTGNTDGTLQFQVNGTTPSVTLNTLGAIGVGSTPNYGTSGQALVSAGSTAAPTWANVTTSPAGSNTQIQYNNAGSFGASSALTFDGAQLSVNGGSSGIPLSLNSNSGGNTNLLFNEGGTAKWYLRNLASNGGFSFYDVNGSSERYRFGPAGQFGVGGANYGTSGQVLTSAGSGAAPTWSTPAAGGFSSMAVFTSSGTWTIPSGVTKCKVTVTGGGGGGGSTYCGGAGGTAIGIVTLSGSTATITVGSGGASGGSGYAGTSSFVNSSTTLTGTGGRNGNTGSGYSPTDGGYATGAILTCKGGTGSGAGTLTNPGGASYWGGGVAGGSGGAYGAGGGYFYYGSPGAGVGGIVVIEY